MTRPQIVRADTLDLQSRERASAADHTNGPNSPRNTQGFAPHQGSAIKSLVEEQVQVGYSSGGQGSQDEDEVDRDLAGSENLTGDEGGYDDDDDMGDRMSSSPSIADDDIDMTMVYALHTFQASVEGQANATKGEHMMLLDDSNSYWWLVKILRDSSIGYLPAEHIETPTERLARLNKHRNIDLASNMLSDNANEKSKNPLKKAMRRRNTKTVAFAPPTFVEASEYEYTTDEEEGENGYDSNEEEETAQAATTESENVETVARSGKPASSLDDKAKDTKSTTEESVKLRTNPTPSSLRHPDSAVFSDDKAETKKITLTPNLLRDDGMDTTTSIKGRGSLDKDKSMRDNGITSPEPRGKDGKKGKKGVLGGLFKRRHRKGKKDDEDDLEDWLHSGTGPEKQSSISSRESEDSQIDIRKEKGEAQRKQQEQTQQQQEQLQQREQQQQEQKQQRERERERESKREPQQEPQREPQQKPAVSGPPSTIRKVEPDSEPKEEVAVHGPTIQQKQSFEVQRSASGSKPTAVHSPDKRSLSQSSHSSETERGTPQEKTITVNSPAETQNLEPLVQSPQIRTKTDSTNNSASKPIYQRSTYQPAQSNGNQSPELPTPIERLSESPEHISYHEVSDRNDLTDATSSGDDTSSSPIESPPEIIERIDEADSPTPVIASDENGAITRTWSDWSLRTYFEDDNDVRDMLIVVQQDKSGAGIVRKDHPDIGPLFEDASTRLADITKRLDGMLGDWLQRKGRTR